MTESPSDADEGDAFDSASHGGEGGRRVPFEDLARDVEERRRASDRVDTFDRLDTDEVGSDGVDADQVWEDLSTETESPSTPADADAEPTPVDAESDGGEEYLVPKRSFCQQCEFFSAPPAVDCTHAGTEIVGIADSERFRVRNCPLVGDDARVGAERSPPTDSETAVDSADGAGGPSDRH